MLLNKSANFYGPLAFLSGILIFWQQPFDFVDDEKFTFRCLYCSDRAKALGIACVLATINPSPFPLSEYGMCSKHVCKWNPQSENFHHIKLD